MTRYLNPSNPSQPINIVWKARRVIRNHYQCEECPLEWSDDLLVQSPGFCPCCDQKLEPYYVEEFEVVRPEFDLGDDE